MVSSGDGWVPTASGADHHDPRADEDAADDHHAGDVTTREGEEAFVRRDSMQLKGEGLIGFGRVPENNSSLTLRYVLED